jgi:hypothetical protein
MFGDAFEYTTDEDKAFSMWWFEAGNPNDQITTALNNTVPKTCNVSYFHKGNPSPEGTDFTECHPYKDSACCEEATVTTVDTLNKVRTTKRHLSHRARVLRCFKSSKDVSSLDFL